MFKPTAFFLPTSNDNGVKINAKWTRGETTEEPITAWIAQPVDTLVVQGSSADDARLKLVKELRSMADALERATIPS
jgi:hypothetical protein